MNWVDIMVCEETYITNKLPSYNTLPYCESKSAIVGKCHYSLISATCTNPVYNDDNANKYQSLMHIKTPSITPVCQQQCDATNGSAFLNDIKLYSSHTHV